MQSAWDDVACWEDQKETLSHDSQPSLHRSCNFATEHLASNQSAVHATNIASVCKKKFGAPKGGPVATGPNVLVATDLTIKLHAMQLLS